MRAAFFGFFLLSCGGAAAPSAGAVTGAKSPLSRKSVEMPKSSLIAIILSVSGSVAPDSHFETDCLETPSASARASCDRPFSLLNF